MSAPFRLARQDSRRWSRRHLSREQQSEIVARYRNGEDVAVLMRDFRISRSHVFKLLNTAIPDDAERKRVVRERKTGLSSADAEMILRRYKSGESCAHLAAEFKVCEKTIRKIAGHIKRAVMRRAFSPDECADIRRRLERGESKEAIARHFKRSPSTIQKAARGYSDALNAPELGSTSPKTAAKEVFVLVAKKICTPEEVRADIVLSVREKELLPPRLIGYRERVAEEFDRLCAGASK